MKSAWLIEGEAQGVDGIQTPFTFCWESKDPSEARREAVHFVCEAGYQLRKITTVCQSTAGHTQDRVLRYVFIRSGHPRAVEPGKLHLEATTNDS